MMFSHYFDTFVGIHFFYTFDKFSVICLFLVCFSRFDLVICHILSLSHRHIQLVKVICLVFLVHGNCADCGSTSC